MTVTPRPRMQPATDTAKQLRRIARTRNALESETRQWVQVASDEGSSVRVIAELAGISPTTAQKYITEHRDNQEQK